MARGMANNEPINSQANTPEYEAGYERAFGDRQPQRGKFVWDAAQGKLVPFEEYAPPPRACDAPIMAGRFYENTCSTDGVDIGSRRKRNEWMRANNLADSDDFKGEWARAEKRRLEVREGKHDSKERHEQIGRTIYELKNRRRNGR